MGCGPSKSAEHGTVPPEAQQTNEARQHLETGALATSVQKLQPIPSSSLRPVEFGLVKGLEYGERSAPALLVVQVRSRHAQC